MAFVAANLGRVTSSASSLHPTVWSYNGGADSIITMVGSGYFNGIADVKIGDIIMCVGGGATAALTTVTMITVAGTATSAKTA